MSDSAQYAQAGSPGSAAAAALRMAEQVAALPSPHAGAVTSVRLQPIDRSDPYQASPASSSTGSVEGMSKSALRKPERGSKERARKESADAAAGAANNAVAALRDAEKEWEGNPTSSSGGHHPLSPINEPGGAPKPGRTRSTMFDAVQTQALLSPTGEKDLLDVGDLRRMSTHSNVNSIYDSPARSLGTEFSSDSSEEGNGLEIVDMDLSKYDGAYAWRGDV